MDNVSAFFLAEVGLLLIAAYLLPTMVAYARGRARPWLVALNVLSGWTIVGWVAALVAALGVLERHDSDAAPPPPMATSPPVP